MSRLELAITIMIVAVLIGIVINRAQGLMVQVEKTNMVKLEGRIRAALGLAVASRIAQGRVNAIAPLAHANPMNLLPTKPVNYLGALDNPTPSEIEPGHWYFDTDNHRLIYRVEHTAAFRSQWQNPPRAAFAIRLYYRDTNANGRHDPGETVHGVKFEPVGTFRWEIADDT